MKTVLSLLFVFAASAGGFVWFTTNVFPDPSPFIEASREKSIVSSSAVNNPGPLASIPQARPLSASNPSSFDLFDRLIPSLLATDPATAVDTIEQWSANSSRQDALTRFARLWAATDPETALRWSADLPTDDRRIAGEALVTHFASFDPASALLAIEFFDVHQGDGRAERIIQSWTEQDAPAAIGWLTARPSGPLVDRLAIRIAWTLAQQDGPAAAAYALEFIPPGPAQDEAVLAVVRHWAARDSSAASSWVDSLRAGPLYDQSRALLRRARLTTPASGS